MKDSRINSIKERVQSLLYGEDGEFTGVVGLHGSKVTGEDFEKLLYIVDDLLDEIIKMEKTNDNNP